jgi:hypothetical protein
MFDWYSGFVMSSSTPKYFNIIPAIDDELARVNPLASACTADRGSCFVKDIMSSITKTEP